jgi:hypothetical protein
VQEFHYLWTAPFEAFTIIALLASLVKKWALPALGIVSVVIFIQYFFGWQIAMNKFKNASNVNERFGPQVSLCCSSIWFHFVPFVTDFEHPRMAPSPLAHGLVKELNTAMHVLQTGEYMLPM